MDLPAAPRILVAALAALLATGPSASAPIAPAPPSDGYLVQQVEVLVYPADGDFDKSGRSWTLHRELSLFEGYLWRYSLRRLSVETHLDIVHRKLREDEFRDYGSRFGFLLDRSPEVESDLRGLGATSSALLLLYDPPADRPNRIAGRTFFEGTHSSIPLSSRYFQEDGFERPLHLVMAHEYLHQIDLAFSRLKAPASFLDPDGAGQADYPPCIDPGGGDLTLRTILQFDRSCHPVDWRLLSPDYGTWTPR
jgi:hypothetical protein